jgi:tape measure domain-containing protein
METDKGKLFFAAGIDNNPLRTGAAETKNIMHGIGQSAKKEGEQMDAVFSKLGATIGGIFAVGTITSFTKQIVSLRGEIQSLEISFQTLAGKAKGDALFKEIREFAVQTPMMLKDLASGAQTMLAFNIEAEKVMPMLKSIGDISMGDAQKFNSLTLAFSQMSATGKLMGQDLLQMINAGFNPLATISEKTGKTIGELKEEMEKGKITTQMVTDAFQAASSEGGKFNGMLEKQSKGINGAISNLQGAIDDMYNAIGSAAEGATVSLISAATDLAKNYEQVGRIVAGLIATYGTYKAALMAVTAAEQACAMGLTAFTKVEALHYGWLVLQEKAQKMLNATMLSNPYVLAATAVAALVAVMISLKTETERLRDAEQAYDEQKQKVIAKEQQHQQEIRDLIEIAGNEAASSETRRLALVKLENQYPSIFEKYQTEAEMLANIKKIKEEIAALDGQTSITNAKNELQQVEDRIQELEAKAKTVSYVTQNTSAGVITQKVGGLTSKEETELKMLQGKRTNLTKQTRKDEQDAFFANLTGLSNDTLEQMIKTREDLLARMKMSGKNYAQINSSGVTGGTFSKEEIDAQLQELKRQQTERSIDTKSGKEWAEEKRKAYETAKKAYNDYVKNSKDKVKEDDFEKEAKRLKGEMETAKKNYDKYKIETDSEDKSGANKQKKDNQTKVEIAERNKQIEDIKKAQQKANRDAALELQQDDLNLQKDSVDKSIQQIKIDAQRMRNALDDRREELLEQYRNIQEKQWQNENPGAKDKGLAFDRTSVTQEDMTKAASQPGNEWLADALAAIDASERLMEQQTLKATADVYKQIIDEVKTYEQQRLDLQKEYQDKRNALYEDDGNGGKKLRAGVTEGNIAELDYQENEAIKNIDEQFAQRQETYQAWCDTLTSASLKKLNEMLAQAKKDLEKLEKDPNADPTKLAQARAKVNKAQQAVNKANEQDKTSPGKRTMKEWEDLYKTLKDVEDEFESIGDTVGGTVGDIISAAGSITSSTLSMITGIVTLANWSVQATKMSAEGASKAIIAVEKASVILAIVGAAMQMAQTIINLFNNDESYQKEIDKLQNRIDQLQWELDNSDVVRSSKTLAAGSYLNTVRDAIASTRKEMVTSAIVSGNWAQAWKAAFKQVSKDSQAMEKTVNQIATAYANMKYTADKALGETKYSSAQDQLKNIAEQQVLIQEQIDQENKKKKTDKDQIADWQQQIEELGQEALEVINDMVEDIIGDTSTGIAEELADAFIEAFQEGEDAAEAWGDKVNDIVADILKNMLVSKFLEEPLGDIFDEYKQKWFVNGQFQGLDAVINSMQDFAADLNAVGEDFAEIWENLPEDVKNMFEVTADREAASSGIATASQESVDELNGRTTAIQGHTYSIAENMKGLLSATQDILQSVMNIETETDGFGARLERMETSLKNITNAMDDITLKGIKIKN